jgi:transcription initiation factor TFIID TATA-box-binding protein
VNIQNVITTANLLQPGEITKFTKFSWGKYDLEYYGGKCGYLKDDKMRGRVTIFLSGKMISTGSKSIRESVEQLVRAMDILTSEKFIARTKLDPKVQNIVATANLGSKIDLNKMATTLTKFILEPEQFPGAIYRSPHGPTCLIFASGKIVIAGAKTEKQAIDTETSLLKLQNKFFIDL